MKFEKTTPYRKIRTALAGLGKMGISHQAIINMHPDMELIAVCDSAPYILDLMSKYTGVKVYSNYIEMLKREELDAIVIATPSTFHESMVRLAIEHNKHVFCEKPFCLNVDEGARLLELAEQKRLVNQVGYHNRFLGTFRKAKNLIDAGVLGEIYHIKAECYGPVVVRPKVSTWRTSNTEGGGCLYDYACHGIDLINFMVGQPSSVSGATTRSIFSSSVEDEVYANLHFSSGVNAQISANWSDDSFRKMSTVLTIWGKKGKMTVNRQELNIYLKKAVDEKSLNEGWTTFYTTSLTDQVWYYLRGEEYSSQIDHFARCIREKNFENISTFRSAHQTDVVAAWIKHDAKTQRKEPTPLPSKDANSTGLSVLRRSLRQIGLNLNITSR
jgi:scyllo-inositol 2-dehydrogenase (NADP+)